MIIEINTIGTFYIHTYGIHSDVMYKIYFEAVHKISMKVLIS